MGDAESTTLRAKLASLSKRLSGGSGQGGGAQVPQGAPAAQARAAAPAAQKPSIDALAATAARLRFLEERARGLATTEDPVARKFAETVAKLAAKVRQASGVEDGDLRSVAKSVSAERAQNLIRFSEAVTKAHHGLRGIFDDMEAGPERERLQQLLGAYEELDSLTREMTAGVIAVNMDKRPRPIDATKLRR